MKPNPKVPRFLSKAQLAERLGVSTKTVSRWIASGELRPYDFGRQVRIAEEDASAYIAARRR
jgi:excisionase family DNA binding protein